MKTLSKTEDGCGSLCRTKTHGDYCISQNTSKDKNRFTLWKIVNGEYEKIGSANSPLDLYEKILWE